MRTEANVEVFRFYQILEEEIQELEPQTLAEVKQLDRKALKTRAEWDRRELLDQWLCHLDAALGGVGALQERCGRRVLWAVGLYPSGQMERRTQSMRQEFHRIWSESWNGKVAAKVRYDE